MLSRKSWKVVLIVFALIDAAICIVAVFVGGNILNNQWDNLGRPTEAAERIVGVEAGGVTEGWVYRGRETKVYVESITGDYYACCNRYGGNPWGKVSKARSNQELFEDCGPIEDIKKFHLPDEQDRLGIHWCGEWDFGTAVYILREDGTIWSRKIYQNPMLTFGVQFFTVITTFVILFGIYISDTIALAIYTLLTRQNSSTYPEK